MQPWLSQQQMQRLSVFRLARPWAFSMHWCCLAENQDFHRVLQLPILASLKTKKWLASSQDCSARAASSLNYCFHCYSSRNQTTVPSYSLLSCCLLLCSALLVAIWLPGYSLDWWLSLWFGAFSTSCWRFPWRFGSMVITFWPTTTASWLLEHFCHSIGW